MTLSHEPPTAQTASLRVISKTPVINIGSSRFLPLGRKPQPIRILGTDCLIRQQASLASLTSFRVGGPAELYLAPRTTEDLQAGLNWAKERGLPITLVGAGSNLLVSDRGLPGLVVCTRHLKQAYFDEATGQLTAAAGDQIARLAWQAAQRGWMGLEWAVGIPGTMGGAVVMNAGAHHACTAEMLVNAHVLAIDGSVELLTSQTLNFGYRTSALQGLAHTASPEAIRLVTQATLQLQPGGDPQQVMAETTAHLNQRRNSQPYHLPSCGSVFRNPKSYKAGWLIEQSGLKGHQIGGAQIAQRHANFILNCGGATAADIFQLIRLVQEEVEKNWSLLLEPEVKMLGEFQTA
jgi:UDP-N-acetylmuramate dehydrogenase